MWIDHRARQVAPDDRPRRDDEPTGAADRPVSVGSGMLRSWMS
jgi:hypothetical protein